MRDRSGLSNVSCTPHGDEVRVAGTFIGTRSLEGYFGVSATIYNSSGSQIGQGQELSVKVVPNQKTSFALNVRAAGTASLCDVGYGLGLEPSN